MKKTKICFVGSDNYPVLNPEYGETYIGGESVQQSLLAIEFARQEYDVSTVVKDNGQQDGEIIHGISIWKSFKEGSGSICWDNDVETALAKYDIGTALGSNQDYSGSTAG